MKNNLQLKMKICLSLLLIAFLSFNMKSQCSLASGFTYTTGANGLVNFTSTSTGTNSGTFYSWNFGNSTYGSGASTSNTYLANGTYTVTLTSVNTPTTCNSSFSSVISITNVPTSTVCSLSAMPNNLINGLNGTFTISAGLTTGTIAGTTYSWSFGNNTFGTGFTASTTYTANGTYMIVLTAINNPTCVSSYTLYKSVTNVTSSTCGMNSSYSYTVGTGGNVSFSSTSSGVTGSTIYSWNFGDGFTASGPNVSHVYSNNGNYNALLTLSNSTNTSCKDTTLHLINITGTTCVANSNFSIAPTPTAQVWTATPSYPWNVTAAQWSWGDGNFSNSLYSAHSYSAVGWYNICLTVTVSCGATSSVCVNSYIYKSSSSMVFINVVPPPTILTALTEGTREDSDYLVYPNPSTGRITLKHKNTIGIIEVFNILGEKLIEVRSEKSENTELDLQHLCAGIYFIQFSDGNIKTREKLILNK